MAKAIRPDHVAVYIRWSTDDQASGTTLETQREGCELYVRSQGWLFREDLMFLDDGFSGGNLDRPAITRMRALVLRGEIDCVVVLKIDRLSRNIVDAVDLVLREWQDRCYLKSVREPIDTNSDLGRVMFNILATFADFERAQIRERTQNGKNRRIAEGKQLHAEPAFGYMKHPTEKGVWIENPQEGDLVRRIFRMAADGMSANKIVRQMNLEGIRTRRDRKWSVRAILWILHNRTYIGEAVYGRTSLKPANQEKVAAAGAEGTLSATRSRRKKLTRVHHEEAKIHVKTDAAPVLVDTETYEVVQNRLKNNQWQRSSMGSRAQASPHLLVGVAQCACGGALVHKVQMGKRNRDRGKEYRHYICHRSRQGLCDANGHIPAEAAEKIVETLFFEVYGLRTQREDRFLPKVQEAVEDRKGINAALQAALDEMKKLEEDDRHLLREVRARRISFDDLRLLRQSIEQDMEELRQRTQTLKQRLADVDSQVRSLDTTLSALESMDRWDKLEAWQKRQLLRMVVSDRITLCKPKGTREITVDIPWAF